MDARIGQLNSGKFYAYVNGYDVEPFIGTLEEVEVALGLREKQEASAIKQRKTKAYTVTIRFQYPAWDEVDGIEYMTDATSKADAIATVRRLAADDGHTGPGRGRYWLTATKYTPA